MTCSKLCRTLSASPGSTQINHSLLLEHQAPRNMLEAAGKRSCPWLNHISTHFSLSHGAPIPLTRPPLEQRLLTITALSGAQSSLGLAPALGLHLLFLATLCPSSMA